MEEHLLVRKIDMGTVVDHIPPWSAEGVLRLIDYDALRSDPSKSVIVLHNVPSRKYGRKDVVKLYRHFISHEEADLICLIYPTATVNYIRDWKVEKYRPRVPERILGRLRCPELSCITNTPREPVRPRFRVLERARAVQCEYCDTLIGFDEIPEHMAAEERP